MEIMVTTPKSIDYLDNGRKKILIHLKVNEDNVYERTQDNVLVYELEFYDDEDVVTYFFDDPDHYKKFIRPLIYKEIEKQKPKIQELLTQKLNGQ